MKIGILTFHRTPNHGAFWQAFSTVTNIRAMGHDVKLIDYANPRERPSLFRYVTPRNFWRIPYQAGMIRRYLAFCNSQNALLPMTRLLRTHADVAKEQFDAVIVGSDIVWDFAAERLGHDPVYFGHGINADKIISYAASCGSVSSDAEIPQYVREGLVRFRHISVRDENSRQLVERAVGRDAAIVLDPAFLLDCRGLGGDFDLKDYVMVYGASFSDSEASQARRFAKARGLKLVSVSYRHPWCDINLSHLNPRQWLACIDKADSVLTGTFHGTIFAMKRRKPLAISMNESIRNKIQVILSQLGMTDRVLSQDRPLEQVLSEPIDYDRVQWILGEKVRASLQWMETAIND